MQRPNKSENFLSEKEWLAIMSDYEKSGLSQKAFCKERDIDFVAFTNSRVRIAYHKKKATVKKAKSTCSDFAEVTVIDTKQVLLKLSHPNGIECTLPASLNDTQLINLIRALHTC